MRGVVAPDDRRVAGDVDLRDPAVGGRPLAGERRDVQAGHLGDDGPERPAVRDDGHGLLVEVGTQRLPTGGDPTAEVGERLPVGDGLDGDQRLVGLEPRVPVGDGRPV